MINDLIGSFLYQESVAPRFLAQRVTTDSTQVDWIEQRKKGGMTVVIPGLLVITWAAIIINRFVSLRQSEFYPESLRPSPTN